MRNPVTRKVAVGGGLALLLAGLVVWIVCREAGRQAEAAARVAHAHEVLATLDGLTSALTDADVHRWAYVTRIDPAHRQQFQEAATAAQAQLQRLHELRGGTSAVQGQMAQVSELVMAKVHLLEESLQRRERNRFADREQLRLTERVQRLTESLQRSLAALRAEEDASLDRQTQESRSAAHQAETLVGIGNLLAIVFLGLTTTVATREVQARGRSEAAAREAQRRAESQAAEQSHRLSATQRTLAELVALRERLEQQLAQSQRLASVGRLTSGVAHDFNNLLTLILGCGEASLRALPPDASSRPFLTEVVQAGRRAADLTRQLLGIARGSAGLAMPLDLNATVAGLEPLLRRLAGRDVEVTLQLAPNLGLVAADRVQVEQILLNLVANARDAMPEGGKLILETRPASEPGMDEESWALLVVGDTGSGMDQETLSRLFEPFFTTKGEGKGTGLGMAIVQDVLQRCGGRIEVDSEPGEGTTMRIYLPLTPDASADC